MMPSSESFVGVKADDLTCAEVNILLNYLMLNLTGCIKNKMLRMCCTFHLPQSLFCYQHSVIEDCFHLLAIFVTAFITE